MSFGIEKAIAAALEPVVEAIVELEKKIAQLQEARDAEPASQPKRSARTRAPRVTPEGGAPH